MVFDDGTMMEMASLGRRADRVSQVVAIATLAVAFVSSAYSGGSREVIAEFGCSQEVYTLGISLFVLGFAIGPLLYVWHILLAGKH